MGKPDLDPMQEIRLPRILRGLRELPLPRKLGLLEYLFGKSLAKSGVCWVSAANGIKWKLNLSDPTHRWIVFGDYEGSAQMNWVRNWLSSGGTVIDSGANIGQMCLYLAPLPKVRVHCFEPLPEAYDWIEECLSIQQGWTVNLNRLGLSDEENTITVQVWGARTTAQLDWYASEEHERIDIETLVLDDYCSNSNIERIRLWKLDVEGHELPALRGASRLLQSRRIDALLVEISSCDVVPFLWENDYRVFKISRSGSLMPIKSVNVSGNCLAFPKVEDQ